MECYEGATMIKTFRGQIAASGQDTIVLHTNDGATGYKIVKFILMPKEPMGADSEHIVKIYKVPQTSVDAEIDFSDNTLIAAGQIANAQSGYYNTGYDQVFFDNEIFNQDIYITHMDTVANDDPVNYYLELEQIKLDVDENTVTTLKDIRNKELRTMIA